VWGLLRFSEDMFYAKIATIEGACMLAKATFRKISTILSTLPVLLMMVMFQNCAGGAGSGAGAAASGTDCAAGHSASSAGVCQLDAALSIVNPANSFWKCQANTVAGVTPFGEFVIQSTTVSSGTGTYLSSTSTTPRSFSWTEISPDTLSIQTAQGTGLPPVATFAGIVPNAAANPTAFSMSGGSYASVGISSVDCSLMSGSM
jgi:hypothetical protein